MADILSATEEFVEAIRQFRERATAAIRRMVIESDQAAASAGQVIQRARYFAIEAGIDKSLARLVRETRHYPATANREDFDRSNVLGVVEVSGGRLDDPNKPGEWVQFRWRGRMWRMTQTAIKATYLTDRIYEFRDQALYVDEQRVFGQSICRSTGMWDDGEFKPVGVNALILGDGQWISDLIEIDQQFAAAEMIRQARWDAEFKRDQVADIKM
jgi:hypothetical protein